MPMTNVRRARKSSAYARITDCRLARLSSLETHERAVSPALSFTHESGSFSAGVVCPLGRRASGGKGIVSFRFS
ncbi:hypothetical protein PUN28_004850 [Cardiocondyla obscurior]|uniref:Uncharacterized protein n=1 Tax=Cardiocondyla obscurior TaxID=286306 RepID=A0AAW2GEN7_9HYME